MRRKILFLLVMVGLLGIAAGAVKYFQSQGPKDGELHVESTPGTNVFLDNKLLGTSPIKDIKVATGEHTVRLEPVSAISSIAPWQDKIMIGANLRTYINATLSESELTSAVDILWLEKSIAKKPELSVLTNPDGATVSINDTTKGITPLTVSDLDTGEDTLTVSSPGFLSRSMKIKLTAGYKLIASLKLALTSAAPEASPTPTMEQVEALDPTAKGTPIKGPSPTKTSTPTKSITPTAAVPTKPYVVIKDTPTGFLRVRMEPTTSSTEAARVKPGEMYHLFDEQSSWYQISYDGTNKGWISSQYATKVE
jgi:hypothetical protein